MGPSVQGRDSQDAAHRSPGETVLLREIWRGRVWSARPVIVVEDIHDRVILYSPHGNHFQVPVTGEGAPLRIYTDDWELATEEWRGPNVLSFAFPGIPYAVLLFFAAGTNELEGYYVNLESPLVRTEVGFDYVEHILDATIPADRSGWSWKDEDELAEAVARGSFTHDDAERFRHWGERAVEHVLLREPPFDRDWTTWRPDPSWSIPDLPDDWETAPIAFVNHQQGPR